MEGSQEVETWRSFLQLDKLWSILTLIILQVPSFRPAAAAAVGVSGTSQLERIQVSREQKALQISSSTSDKGYADRMLVETLCISWGYSGFNDSLHTKQYQTCCHCPTTQDSDPVGTGWTSKTWRFEDLRATYSNQCWLKGCVVSAAHQWKWQAQCWARAARTCFVGVLVTWSVHRMESALAMALLVDVLRCSADVLCIFVT